MSTQPVYDASGGLRPYRPGILDLVTVVSFILSGVNVLWLIAVGLLIVLAGALTWLGGPVVGTLGTAVGGVVLLFLISQFLLSILLFTAAWKTMKGDPVGRSRHKTWAWIIVILDLLALLFSAGFDLGAWFRLGYAVFLIFIMDRPEVRAYFEGLRGGQGVV